ncbi:23S rRNA (adenine(1618)-N(6))-methyltransferase RlmF [Daejeonella sp.]|uniref:23S rRNA (adenine(1618)-N(6))-methyltransferase RlmF n=1 Tax=Daejeonella sp. TaxID=2805397 RepID=UPI0030BE455B
MTKPERSKNEQKDQLHARNKHRDLYNFEQLIKSCPELGKHVAKNDYGNLSIDFKDADAVKTLNKALLIHFYGVELWDIPEGYLCPPIPGRADYIHYLADLLKDADGKVPTGKSVRVLDIGTGANCIYPLIGHKEYRWTFVGSEIDYLAIRSAKNIIEANQLTQSVSIRKQSSADHILDGVIHRGERFDAVICNPPFHSSLQESMAGTDRKWKNLGKEAGRNDLNFGGKNSELWCEGGELRFVSRMIQESAAFADSVVWFSSLISKKETLPVCYSELKKANATDVRTIPMSQGQKISRILAWKFK